MRRDNSLPWLFAGTLFVSAMLLFFVERSWGFSWVILGLGVISIFRGAYHWVRAGRGQKHNEPKG